MALFKSTIFAQLSGSVNGMTFSHNQGGAYARNRSAVSNPQTGRQDQVRTAMTSLSKMWGQALTQAQRDDWNAYGGTISVVNRVGDIISLSGIAAFNRLNLFRVGTLNESPILSPPGNPPSAIGETIPAYNDADFVNDGGQLDMQVTLTAEPGAYSFVAWYSAPISPGIRFFRGPYAGYEIHLGQPGTVQGIRLGELIAVEDQHRAVKLTMYETATGLPVWTVHIDPMVVEAPVP